MFGAILALPALTLWIVAISMNAVVVHRILAMRRTVIVQPDIARQL